jgi:hypothetical protein
LSTPPIDNRQRQLAALCPLACAAAAFIHPVATTLVPFVMYLLLHRQPFAAAYAIRTADLAFTLQILLFLTDLLLVAMLSMAATANHVDAHYKTLVVAVLLSYFFISLAYAVVQGFRGRNLRYLVSFHLAERVLQSLQGRRLQNDQSGNDN